MKFYMIFGRVSLAIGRFSHWQFPFLVTSAFLQHLKNLTELELKCLYLMLVLHVGLGVVKNSTGS